MSITEIIIYEIINVRFWSHHRTYFNTKNAAILLGNWRGSKTDRGREGGRQRRRQMGGKTFSTSPNVTAVCELQNSRLSVQSKFTSVLGYRVGNVGARSCRIAEETARNIAR